MKRLLFLFSFLYLASNVFGQTVDLLRLGYDTKTTLSDQTSLTVSIDGTKIAFSYENKTIKIVDARSGKVSKVLQGTHDDLFEIRFNQAGNKLISIGNKTNVTIIDIATGDIDKEFNVEDKITRVAVSPTEDILAIGIAGSKVLIYDVSKGSELIQTIAYKSHHVSALDFDPTGKNLAVAYMPGMRKKVAPRIYDVHSGNELAEIDQGIYYGLKYTSNGKNIILAGLKGMSKTMMYQYNVESGILTEAYKKINWVSLTLYTSIIEMDGFILSSSIDKAFEVVDFKSKEVVYSTKREKTKGMQMFAKMGIDKTRIYPLQDGKSMLINYSGSNVNQIYNTETKQIQAFIYSDANIDLATIARDGRLDGNVEAISKLFWTERKSNKRISLDATFDKYYTPRLLPNLLSGAATEVPELNIEEDLHNIPVVSIAVSNNSSELKRDPDSGIIKFSTKQKNISLAVLIDSFPEFTTEIKLYHNGKLKSILPTEGKSSFNFPVNLNSSFGENNFFFAVASNKNGIESPKAKMIVKYEADNEAKPNLYVLILGINEYKNPRYKLNYAISDAKGIAEIVKDGNSTLFEKINIHTLYDHEVTKVNVIEKFGELANVMHEQDVFMFYYAGHGTLDQDDAANEFYIVPYDIVQLYGNSEALKANAISATEIRDISVKLNPQKQVYIIDACHSAGALESSLTRGAAEERAFAQLARSTGTFWLTAAGSEQFATEFEELGHGVFTYSLLEALSGKDYSNGDGTLTIRELSSYVEMRVPELSEKYKGQAQYPASFSFGNDFPIKIISQ
jgi:WD40 repeat protein